MNVYLKILKDFIEQFAPAIAVALWNYQSEKVQAAKDEALDAQVNLELEKNHEAVDKANSNLSDMDVVSNAIKDDGGPK